MLADHLATARVSSLLNWRKGNNTSICAKPVSTTQLSLIFVAITKVLSVDPASLFGIFSKFAPSQICQVCFKIILLGYTQRFCFYALQLKILWVAKKLIA